MAPEDRLSASTTVRYWNEEVEALEAYAGKRDVTVGDVQREALAPHLAKVKKETPVSLTTGHKLLLAFSPGTHEGKDDVRAVWLGLTLEDKGALKQLAKETRTSMTAVARVLVLRYIGYESK